jgi:hypothetical protein
MNHFWTDEERKRLNRAHSYEEAVEVALVILSRMNETGREVVQVCGPMSTGGLGNPADNLALFQLAINRALANNLMVFDQLPFQPMFHRLSQSRAGDGTYDWDILEVFYKKIFASRYVRRALFLPGWEGSIGACWERDLVTRLGLVVEDYPASWLV